MFIALNENGHKIDVFDAAKENAYFCPLCKGKLCIKDGQIRTKHFAHFSSRDCDDFTSDMSEWHKRWQEQFPINNREVVIQHNKEKHRADVLAYGHVIEFQHSPISCEEFNRRNAFYTSAGKKVVWIFDLTEDAKTKKMRCYDEWQKDDYNGGKWNWEYSKRCFQDYFPQEEKDVFLFFQIAETDFLHDEEQFYIERVVWADERVNNNFQASFASFDTVYTPGNKTELLEWIKNRGKHDIREGKVLYGNYQHRKPWAPPRDQKHKHVTNSVNNKPTTLDAKTTPPAIDEAALRNVDFNQPQNVKDGNGNRVVYCTICQRWHYDFDMTDYQFAKGICRECAKKSHW